MFLSFLETGLKVRCRGIIEKLETIYPTTHISPYNNKGGSPYEKDAWIYACVNQHYSLNLPLYLYFYLPFSFRKILRIRKYKKRRRAGYEPVVDREVLSGPIPLYKE